MGRGLPAAVMLAGFGLGLAGCALPPGPTATTALVRPAPRIEQPAPEPSAQSRALMARYAQLQQNLLARGLLRVDGGGPDTPFGARELTDNFIRVALFDEYVYGGGRVIGTQTPAALRRWTGPVRIGLEFGASVPETRRARDRASVAALAARLSRLTGLPVSLVDQGANFRVAILSEDERPARATAWAAGFPGLDVVDLTPAVNLDPSTLCLVMAVSQTGSDAYSGALAVVRSELPDLLRLSCLHEEIVQGFGLANDYPRARPSIFNDDEEFATLTTHDEFLLRILYDRRLRPGMTEAQVRPILPAILAGLIAPPS